MNNYDQRKNIIYLILKDHKILKNFISLLINWNIPLQKRRRAFDQLRKQLVIHQRSEEETFYAFLKLQRKFFHLAGLKSQTEHEIIDRLLDEVSVAENPLIWSVRSRVLAEFLLSHLVKEECETLMVFKKEFTDQDLDYLGKQYLDLKHHYTLNRLKKSYDHFSSTGFSSPRQVFYDM